MDEWADDWNFKHRKQTIDEKIANSELELEFYRTMKETAVIIKGQPNADLSVEMSEFYGVPFEIGITCDDVMQRYFPKSYFEKYGSNKEVHENIMFTLENNFKWNTYRNNPKDAGWQESTYDGGC